MRPIIVLFFLVGMLWNPVLPAQNADSLRNVIRTSDDLQARLNAKLLLGDLLRSSRPDSSLKIARSARKEAAEIGDTTTMAKSFLVENMAYLMMGELDSALEAGKKAVALASTYGDSALIAKSRMHVGGILAKKGNSEDAKVELFSAISVFQKNKDTIHWAMALNTVGSCFFQDGDLDRAAEYYEKSRNFYETQGYEPGVVTSELMLGNIALEKRELDKALEMYAAAIPYYERLGNAHMLGLIYNNIGVAHLYAGRLDDQLKSLNRALEYRRQTGNKDGIAITLSNIASIYRETGEFGKSIRFNEESLELAAEIRALGLMREILDELSILYRKRDPEMAFMYLDSSLVIDSILTDKAMKNEAAEMEARYQSEQQQIEIELLRKTQTLDGERAERAEQLGYFLVGGIVLLLIVIAIVVYFSSRTSRLNRSLERSIREQEETAMKLKVINQELNTLLHRSSHDIKSPLNSVQGLTTVMRDMEGSEKFMPYLDMIESRLLKLKEFVSNLLMSGNIDPDAVRLEPVLANNVLDAVLADLENMKGYEAITIHREINYTDPFVTESSVLRSTMQNLISNAIKYRQMDRSDAQCWVRFDRVGSEVRLEVEDNGIGIGEDHLAKLFEQFSRFSIQSEGSGVGLYLVKKGLEKLGGRIEVESEAGKVTTFRAFLPFVAAGSEG